MLSLVYIYIYIHIYYTFRPGDQEVQGHGEQVRYTGIEDRHLSRRESAGACKIDCGRSRALERFEQARGEHRGDQEERSMDPEAECEGVNTSWRNSCRSTVCSPPSKRFQCLSTFGSTLGLELLFLGLELILHSSLVNSLHRRSRTYPRVGGSVICPRTSALSPGSQDPRS